MTDLSRMSTNDLLIEIERREELNADRNHQRAKYELSQKFIDFSDNPKVEHFKRTKGPNAAMYRTMAEEVEGHFDDIRNGMNRQAFGA